MIKKITILLILLFCTASAFFLAGARVNYTVSFPIGLYWTQEKTVETGDLVTFCPPNTDVFKSAREYGFITYGFCANEYGELLKRVVAQEGDKVTLNQNGVSVNGVAIQNTKPVAMQDFPHFKLHNYTLKKGEVLLISDHHPLSFDARYFGLVKATNIQDVVKPIWTKEEA